MKLVACGYFLVFYCASASAYVDPGSSLLMLQGLFALVGGILVFVKNPIGTVKSLAQRMRRRGATAGSDASSAANADLAPRPAAAQTRGASRDDA